MGIAYQSICGCLTSAPEPSLCECESEEEYAARHAAWEHDWSAQVEAHDAYACEDRKREGA